MTVYEAIERLDKKLCHEKEPHKFCRDSCMYGEDCCEVQVAKMCMEKQIPKKPIYQPHRNGIMVTNYKCPVCGCRRLGHGVNLDKCYCPECGQKLDLEEGGTSD